MFFIIYHYLLFSGRHDPIAWEAYGWAHGDESPSTAPSSGTVAARNLQTRKYRATQIRGPSTRDVQISKLVFSVSPLFLIFSEFNVFKILTSSCHLCFRFSNYNFIMVLISYITTLACGSSIKIILLFVFVHLILIYFFLIENI